MRLIWCDDPGLQHTATSFFFLKFAQLSNQLDLVFRFENVRRKYWDFFLGT